MKNKSLFVDITGNTKPQMETTVNNRLNNGWVLNGIYHIGNKDWAVFVRSIIKY